MQISRNHLHFAHKSPLCGIVHKGSAFCTQSASIYEGIGERGELVGGVTTPESWPMGTPRLAMALYWPTGKLVDGGEQINHRLRLLIAIDQAMRRRLRADETQ